MGPDPNRLPDNWHCHDRSHIKVECCNNTPVAIIQLCQDATTDASKTLVVGALPAGNFRIRQADFLPPKQTASLAERHL